MIKVDENILYGGHVMTNERNRKHQKRSKDQAKESHAVLFRHRHHRTKHGKMEHAGIRQK